MNAERSLPHYEAIFDRCDRDERSALVAFLVAFAEFDRHKLPIEHGYPSSFAYLTEKRGYSKSAAGRRITVARLIARHPIVVDYLRDGRVGLTTLSILAEILFSDVAVAEVLERAAGKNEDEVMRLKAALRPRPAPPELVRRLPASQLPAPGAATSPEQLLPAARPAVPPRRDQIVPVNADLFVFRMTVTQAFIDDLGRLRDQLSHKLRDGRTDEVLHDAVRVAIDHYQRRRLGRGQSTHRPRSRSGRSRHVPVEVRRAVWERDQGRCTYVSEGRRCGATWQLQNDHVWAFARGGPPTIDNIRLRCGAHNRLGAEQDFGRAHVEARMRERRG